MDQQIEELEKKLLELKRLKRDALQKQTQALQKEQSDALIKLIASPDPSKREFETKFKSSALQTWLSGANDALKAATAADQPLSIEDVRKVLVERLGQLPVSELEKEPAVIDTMTAFIKAYLPYQKRKREILDEVAKGTLVTVEYTNYREVNAPDVSNFRFIAERGTLGGVNLTAKASLSLYNRLPVAMNGMLMKEWHAHEGCETDPRFQLCRPSG